MADAKTGEKIESSSSHSSTASAEQIDIDEFLIRSGECGLYQIRFVLLMKILTFPSSFPIFIFYFIGIDPSWVLHKDSTVHPKTDDVRCGLSSSEWSYNYSKSTVVTEYDLICDRSWLLGIVGSSVFIGWGVGSVLMGYLSDLYGRKTVMFPCIMADLLCLCLHFFIKPLWLLIIIRFIMGVFHAGPATNGFIILVEIIGPNCRVLAANVAGSVWVIGAAVLALKAHLIDSWRTLCAVASAPYFVLLITWFCIPESVRWLNNSGRTEDALTILQDSAKFNAKADMTNVSIKPAKQQSVSYSYMDLFKQWKTIRIVLTQAFFWFVSGMVYYTYSWAFADLGGDIYINFFISIAVEVPMHVVAVFALQMFGRKKSVIISFFATSVACVLVALSSDADAPTMRLMFGLFGKSMISLSFMCIYMWSAELYPTVIRTQGMGINIVTSRAGAAISPFVTLLDSYDPSAPFLVMAAPTFLAFLLCFTLPETLGKPTKETFEELTED